MARARMIQPEFWDDPKMGALPRDVRLCYIGMWSLADDAGNLPLSAGFIRSRLFPYDEDLQVSEVAAWVEALVTTKRLVPYHANGERYATIVNFPRHQHIEKPSKWRYPLANECESVTSRGVVPDTVGEESGNTTGSARAHPETQTQTQAQTETQTTRSPSTASQIDPDRAFWAFWEEYPPRNGKKLGKDKALGVWRQLSQTKRTAALRGVVHYRNSGELPKDAHRWLRDGSFADWQTPAVIEPIGANIHVNGKVHSTPHSRTQEAIARVASEMGVDQP